MGLPINKNQDLPNQQSSSNITQNTINTTDKEQDINKSNPNEPLREFEVSTSKSFHVLNMAFASKKVVFDFLLYSALVILVPIILVFSTYNYVKDNPAYSQLDKIIVSVGPSLLLINVIIGIYIYKAIKDPENYKKDPNIKPVIPVGLKQQNMNRRMNAKKQLSMQNEQKQEENKKNQQQKKPKSQ